MNKLKTNIIINESINLKDNLPILFDIKSKTTLSKQQNYIKSDTGKTRHYTPAAQEWYNSIYSYNPNYIKTLPVADKNLMNLLKSYFNFELNENILKTDTKPISIRYKRLSSKKIFVGKGELKHTSTKVLITFYVFNTEGMFLSSNYKKVKEALYYPKKELKMFVNYDRDGNAKITYNRPHSIYEYGNLNDHYESYHLYIMSIINKFANSSELDLLNTYYDSLTSLVETKLLTEEEKQGMFYQKVAK